MMLNIMLVHFSKEKLSSNLFQTHLHTLNKVWYFNGLCNMKTKRRSQNQNPANIYDEELLLQIFPS